MNRTPIHPSPSFSATVWPSLFGTLDDEELPPPLFAEPIRGLQVREIDGADVFRQFFGRAPLSH